MKNISLFVIKRVIIVLMFLTVTAELVAQLREDLKNELLVYILFQRIRSEIFHD